MYGLTDIGRATTWVAWKRVGGCDLGDWEKAVIAQSIGAEAHWPTDLTLGRISDIDAGAGRVIARYAHEQLGRVDLAQTEVGEL